MYLIWSNEHGCWWRGNRCGYTNDLAQAGRYERHEAITICIRARGGWKKNDVPPEIPVLEADALDVESAGRAPSSKQKPLDVSDEKSVWDRVQENRAIAARED